MSKKAIADDKRRGGKSLASTSYGAWRWYAPTTLETDEGTLLPASAADTILDLTGYKTLALLNEAVSMYERGQIAMAVHMRLAKLFRIDVCPSAADEPLEIALGRRTYSVAYPFAPAHGASSDLLIAALEVRLSDTRGTVRVSGRVSASAKSMLMPRNQESAHICNLLCNGSIVEHTNAVGAWLVGSGLDRKTVDKITANQDSIGALEQHVIDRIESLLYVGPSPGLEAKGAAYLNGEEEKGFLRC